MYLGISVTYSLILPRYQWYVPVEYQIRGSDEIIFEWLKPHSTVLVEFDFDEEGENYIRLNMNSAGYYVVNYSYDLNKRLTKHFNESSNYQVSLSVHSLTSFYMIFISN